MAESKCTRHEVQFRGVPNAREATPSLCTWILDTKGGHTQFVGRDIRHQGRPHPVCGQGY